MAILSVEVTRRSHIRYLLDNMREKDLSEMLEEDKYKSLLTSWKRSHVCKTFLIDGKVAAITGVSGGFLAPVGNVWLLTTNEVYNIPSITYVREYKKEIRNFLEIHERLEGFVKKDYYESVKLLKMVGANIVEERNILGVDFYRFEING